MTLLLELTIMKKIIHTYNYQSEVEVRLLVKRIFHYADYEVTTAIIFYSIDVIVWPVRKFIIKTKITKILLGILLNKVIKYASYKRKPQT